MAQIFVAITVDAITLAESKPGGSWNAPISLGSYSSSDVYVEMMAQGSAVVNDQGLTDRLTALGGPRAPRQNWNF